VKDDAMVFLAQKRFAGCLGSEHAGLTFDAEVAVEAAMLRNKANDGLGEMDVEVVADDIPPCVLAAALLSKVSRKRAKSCSVRVSPITPATLPVVTSKPAIRVCVPWRRYSNSHRSTLPGFIGNPGAMRSSA
jgi:hypothetical protein